MKTKFSLSLLLTLLFASNLFSQQVDFTRDVFDDWIQTRIGDGSQPVFWKCFGEVYSYPDGELICKMEGVDMGWKKQITEDSILQISRKIFIYTDPVTGEALKSYNGNPVQHIAYPYQLISYVRDNDKMRTWVTQGSGQRLTTIGPGTQMSARKLGKNIVFSAPLFLNFETPRGKYEAYENYDFIYNKSAESTADQYQIIWVRYGDRAAFAGKGKGIIQLVCHRVDTWDELPDALKSYIRSEAPMWQGPPNGLEEINSLQKSN